MHREHVVAGHVLGPHPEGGRPGRDRARFAESALHRHRMGQMVVLAGHQQRRSERSRHAQGLGEKAVGRTAVADEADRHEILAQPPRGPGRSRGPGHASGDNRILTQEAAGDVVQVHRAALAARGPLPQAQQLGDDGRRAHSLRNRMTVAPVCGRDQIRRPEATDHPRGSRLLSHRGMERAVHPPPVVQRLDASLEFADAHHGLVELKSVRGSLCRRRLLKSVRGSLCRRRLLGRGGLRRGRLGRVVRGRLRRGHLLGGGHSAFCLSLRRVASVASESTLPSLRRMTPYWDSAAAAVTYPSTTSVATRSGSRSSGSP